MWNERIRRSVGSPGMGLFVARRCRGLAGLIDHRADSRAMAQVPSGGSVLHHVLPEISMLRTCAHSSEQRSPSPSAVFLLSGVAAAGAAPPSASSTGYDVSYPQCGRRLPAPGAFAIVGVNGGLPYSANPCLATQYQWATTSSGTKGPRASLYINTANPGPVVSTHWPTGQQSPQLCDGSWSTG